VFDCRDAISPLPDTIPRSKQIITGGYDGFNATIHLFPNLDNIFGDEDVRYRITPSYLVPPVFIAATMINYMCVELPREMSAVQKKRKVSVSDTVMTSRIFNIDFTRLSRHLRFMFEGVQANKNLKVGTLMKKFPVE
jgi:hypothetical protein